MVSSRGYSSCCSSSGVPWARVSSACASPRTTHPVSRGEISATHRHALSRNGQFGYFCGMGKTHSCRCPMPYVRCKSLEVSQRDIRAVDIFVAGLIDKEQVVGAVSTAYIHVLAQLDISFGAENDEPSVAPVGEGIRRIPVDAKVPLRI